MSKVLLITGASSDIGVQLLRAVYNDYECIYLQYRNMNSELEKCISEFSGFSQIVPVYADFTDINSVQTMIDKIKEFEIIPNNIVHLSALKAYNSQFHKDKWDNYELGWQISVRSVVLLLQAFISAMAKKHYGRVVFMLTSYTKNIPEKYQSSYVTIKYALLGLMKSLSAEYIDKAITINGVSPDMIETKFLSNIPELIIEKNKVNSPLGRNIYIEEVIPVIQHMLSDLGASMTGQNIVISGGIR